MTTTLTAPFKIGQSVRILQGSLRPDAVADVYTILRCNEPDSRNPSYVIENEANHRQRRESHDQLVSAAARDGLTADAFRGRDKG